MRPPNHSRPVPLLTLNNQNPHPSALEYEGGPHSSFTDVAPLMLASSASLADAHRRIEEARASGTVEWKGDVRKNVTIDRWRPNWVLDGMFLHLKSKAVFWVLD